MAMTKQFKKTQWNNDREPAITAEQLNRMEKGIDDNDTRIVELDKAVTANKTAGDKRLEEMNKTLQKHTEDITAVNTELTSQSKAIGELADKKITKFYASSQGDSTLSDSDDGKMQDMMLYGKSEQKQYSGKNLLDSILDTTTENGITCTKNSDGTYTFNGTATENTMFRFTDDKSLLNVLEMGKNYKFVSQKIVGSEDSFYSAVQQWNSSWESIRSAKDFGNGATFSKEQNVAHIRAFIQFKAGASVSKMLVKPMITTDLTATYDDFEPYVGGIPSPNPDYPQEIKSVVEPVVKVTGKNLLNATLQTITRNGVTCMANGDGTYTVNGTATANTSFDLTNSRSNTTGSGTYKIIGCPFGGSGSSYGLQPNVDGVWLSSKEMEVGNGLILSPLKSIENIAIFIRKETTVNNLIFKPMITTDLTATYDDYEPYHEQSVTLTGITLNAIPVSSGGNVTIDGQQYVADYVDVERGKIVRMCKEVNALDYEWTDKYPGYVSIDFGVLPNCAHSNNVAFAKSTHDYYTFYRDGWNIKNTVIFLNADDGKRGTRIAYNLEMQSIYSNLAEFKEWLKSQADNGTPLKIVYALATPTEESLSDELAEKLKALQTYYPQTNLFITSNQLDGYAIFNYPISLANGWNYVKQQIGDTRDYIYDMDLQMAQAYVNSEYAVALTELEV